MDNGPIHVMRKMFGKGAFCKKSLKWIISGHIFCKRLGPIGEQGGLGRSVRASQDHEGFPFEAEAGDAGEVEEGVLCGGGLVLFFLEEGGAAFGDQLDHEVVVILLVLPEDARATEHVGSVTVEEIAGGLFALGVVEAGEERSPLVPEVGAFGELFDGTEGSVLEIGSSEKEIGRASCRERVY
jgi:hypothetical protein